MPEDVMKAFPGADKFMLAAHLHSAFNELDWSNYKTDDDSSEGSILKTIHVAELSLISEYLVGFVGTEDERMDDGVGKKWVIYTTEQLQESFIFYYSGDGGHHSQAGVGLHVYLDCI